MVGKFRQIIRDNWENGIGSIIGCHVSPDLKIGMIIIIFQVSGKGPVLNDALTRWAIS